MGSVRLFEVLVLSVDTKAEPDNQTAESFKGELNYSVVTTNVIYLVYFR